MKRLIFLLLCWSGLILQGCKPGFEAINYGKEACAHCRMTIMDPSFAAELVTPRGKVFKFDDVACMKQYIREHQLADNELLLFVADFSNTGKTFIDARKAFFIHSESYSSPMNGNSAAFASREAAGKQRPVQPSTVKDWNSL